MLNKTLINVFDAYFFSQDKKLLMTHENLTNSSIAGKATETEIRNGRGNAVFATISSDKTLTVTLESNVFDFNLLCLQCGVIPEKKVGDFYTEAKVYEITVTGTGVSANGTITLDKAPKNTKDVQVIDLKTDELIDSSKVSVQDTTLTLTGITTGRFKVIPYLYTATEKIESVTIEADKFSSAGVLVLKGMEVDANQVPANYIEIVIERAKPSSDFTIDAQSQLTGNKATITLQALKDEAGNLGIIKRIPVKSAVVTP